MSKVAVKPAKIVKIKDGVRVWGFGRGREVTDPKLCKVCGFPLSSEAAQKRGMGWRCMRLAKVGAQLEKLADQEKSGK